LRVGARNGWPRDHHRARWRGGRKARLGSLRSDPPRHTAAKDGWPRGLPEPTGAGTAHADRRPERLRASRRDRPHQVRRLRPLSLEADLPPRLAQRGPTPRRNRPYGGRLVKALPARVSSGALAIFLRPWVSVAVVALVIALPL